MANNITTYKKIKSIRDTLKTVSKEMQNAVNGLPSASYKTKGGAILSTHATSVSKVFNSAEGNLTEAHKAANALGGVKSKPKASSISYKISKCSGNSDIYISDSDALTSTTAMGSCLTKLKTLKTDIQTCYNEINSINITEQLISSLTIIDFLFPLAGMTKAAQILYVKNVGTTNLKQAKSDISKIISYCESLKKEVTASVNDFAKCEENVKRRTYDDLIKTTSNITETSGTSEEDMKSNIAALEAKQKEYIALYGSECPEIKEEIARLKNLYESLYGFSSRVEAMKKKEGFRQGDYWGYNNTYVNYYNGYYIGGSQCFAMAHMMQIEVMGGRGYNIGSKSKSDIQVGDCINYDGPGTSAQYGHWVFVLEKTDDYIIVSEGNYGQKVNYDRKIYLKDISIRQIDRYKG